MPRLRLAPQGNIASDGYVISFEKGITIDQTSVNRTVIRVPSSRREYAFGGLSIGLRHALYVLATTGATEDELAYQVEELDGRSALATLYYLLFTLTKRGVLTYGVSCDGRRVATLAAASSSFSFSPALVDPRSKYVLSRFAYLHRDQQELILESPLAHGKIILHGSDGAAVLVELASGRALGDLCCLVPSVARDALVLFLGMLFGTGFLCELRHAGPHSGESDALAQWEFHDLLFHARSRLGRHAKPFGGTYRFHNEIKALPAIKQLDTTETIDLYSADLSLLKQNDLSFTQVLEKRRSIRQYGERPITGDQLGEFLYRSSRVKELKRTPPQELSRRPYPGGGAIYELELYVNVHCCAGIPAALYHYCPDKHRLEKICDATKDVESLLKEAASSARLADLPQVLISIAARFQRLSWKYESMAYSVLLKNVGVLYQTMYLVATAMDLAPCALGGGDSDLFARAVGLDYYAETSVGEFLLGSKGPN